MKRLALTAAVLLAVAALVYPFEGIWFPGQIVSASVDGHPVPDDRVAALYWDLQRSRISDAPSKCIGWVDLQLRRGKHKQARLSQAIALERWATDCAQ